jgi:hypothetical protein
VLYGLINASAGKIEHSEIEVHARVEGVPVSGGLQQCYSLIAILMDQDAVGSVRIQAIGAVWIEF